MAAAEGPRWRRILAPILIGLTAFFLVLAGLTLYAAQNVFDADRFAERAAAALAEGDVRSAVSTHIAAAIVDEEPDLIGARPLIQGATDGIVASEPFNQLFRGAVADLHRTVLEGERDTAALKVADAGVLVIEALQTFAPKVAERVPEEIESRLIDLSDGGPNALADAAQVAEDVRWAAIASLALAILAAAGALAASTDRRRATRRLAVSAAATGALGVALIEVGRALLGARIGDPVDAAAAQAVWDAFLLDLRTWSLVLAALGVIVAAASAGLIRPVRAGAWPARGLAVLTATPATAGRRVARAVALVAAGFAIVLFPEAAMRLAVLAFGAFLLYAGVSELLRLTLPAEDEDAGVHDRRPASGLRARRLAVVGAVGMLTLGAVVAVALAGDDRELPPFEISACNGSPELCDRSLDEAVFPSTHNSFSAADQPGWLFAQHEKGIAAQLEAGVRGLLIDTHYGVRTDRGVYTVLERGSASREKIEAPLGKEFVETAERLRSRIGYAGGGTREVFLCHGFCEPGAIDAAKALAGIREFLVQNPYEVLVVSVESDIGLEANAAAFKESGLLDLVWKEPLGSHGLPTLREMIEADERVLVLVWQRGPLEDATFSDYPWMHRQFGVVQETPYEFKTRKELLSRSSCRRNGGADGNPLFLLNHWVDTSPVFLPSNARRVNAYDELLKRARTCQRIRGRLPNLVAVDFYQEGDLFGVTRTLNGL